MERDPRGWKVSPAPDGRGKPEEPKPPGRRAPSPPGGVGWRFIGVIVALLALNFILSTTVFGPKENPQVTVPYSPYFLQQVDKSNVKEISAQGETVQGHFKAKVDYKGNKTDRFKTQVPTFANTDQLSKSLQDHNVTINAEPENPGRGILSTILLGFGPTILLVLLFFWFARRAAAGGSGGPLGAFGRSPAKRVEATTQSVTFADVAGIDEAESELEEIVDFL